MVSERENGGIRQAAILMASVDSQTARQLLQQMPTATAKAVRKAMVDLGRIDVEEQRAVLAAFRSRVQANPKSSIQSTPSSPTNIGSSLRQDNSIALPNAASSSSLASGSSGHLNSNPLGQFPTGYWDQYSADQIVEVVTFERPTVIAVVLTQLQPIIANQVLGKLASELRKEVLVQLSRLQQVEAEIVQEIKEQLQQKLMLTRPVPPSDQQLGMNRLKSILEAGDDRAKVELCQAIQDSGDLTGPLSYWVKEQLNSIDKTQSNESKPAVDTPQVETDSGPVTTVDSAKRDPNRREESLAGPRVKDPLSRGSESGATYRREVFDQAHSYIDFDDLKWIGLNQLALILQTCDPRAMLVALSTADDKLLQRVSMLFSKKDWKRLHQRLGSLGQVDDEDRIAARMIVAETAQQLLIGEDWEQSPKTTGHSIARAA